MCNRVEASVGAMALSYAIRGQCRLDSIQTNARVFLSRSFQEPLSEPHLLLGKWDATAGKLHRLNITAPDPFLRTRYPGVEVWRW